MSERDDWPYERVCPMCGKRFCMTSAEDWQYAITREKRMFYCSWTCKRKAEQQEEQAKVDEEMKNDQRRQREMLKKMAESGASNAKICQALGVTKQVANYYIRKAQKKAAESVEPELEGDRWSCWYVCGACHGTLRDGQEKCRCGKYVKWG